MKSTARMKNPTLLPDCPAFRSRELKNTAVPASAAIKHHVTFMNHLRVDMGRNIHATRTAAPAMPYAPDLRILKDGDITPNKDYTTGRPYIEACRFGTQTLSCQQITSICVTWSTPKNTHPSSIQVASRTSRLYITACKFITQLV